MEHHVLWGLPVALDLFLAALGAGAFMIAVIADMAGGKRYRMTNMLGAVIAPWPVLAGVALLVIDLGKPFRFWEMMLVRGDTFPVVWPFIMFNPTSTMSIGSWLLTVFVYVSFAYIGATFLSYPLRWMESIKKIIGVVGLPIALLVTVYTGVLISATTNPLWNSKLLPVAFVASAMVSGAASILFVMATLRILGMVEDDKEQIPSLEKLTGKLIVFQLVAMLLFVVFGLSSGPMMYIIGHGYGLLWWVGIVGLCLLLPLVVSMRGRTLQPSVSLTLSALVLMGGFFLRYVILIAGQVA